MITKYHKLVRDKIPEIIRESGQSCCAEELSPQEYLLMLEQKLGEELAEYLESREQEELADLLEVMHALVAARGERWEDLEHLRLQKRSLRGGFEKRLLLTQVMKDCTAT